jgi:hypothetical protein
MTTPILGLTEMTEGQSAKHVLFNTNIAALELAMSGILETVTSVGMQTGDGKTNLFTVPTDHKAIITAVAIRLPTASLAGGTDFDFGDGANADTWLTAVDLSGMTSTAHYMIIRADNQPITIFDAADVFGIKPITGSTADADATIDVMGYLYEV